MYLKSVLDIFEPKQEGRELFKLYFHE